MENMSREVKKHAYGYLRVSTVGQADGASLDTQREKIAEFASKNSIDILEWFEDPGVSAKTANRPGLQAAIKSVEQHKGSVDYLIVYNMTRASRDMESYYRYICGPLKDCGVRILDSTLPFSEDGDDAATLLMQNMQLLVGEMDNRQKSKTVTDNMKAVAREGWWLTSAPLGFKTKKIPIGIRNSQGKMRSHTILEPDNSDEVANKMTLLLTRFSQGDMNEADACRLADKIGLRSRKGAPLAQSTISLYLRMPVYAGYHRHKSLLGNELIKLRFPGLISWETYEANQHILEHGYVEHKTSDNAMYPLKMTLLCSQCGAALRASAPKGGSGQHSPRYHCKHKGHGSLAIEPAHDLFVNLLDSITPTEATLKLFKEIVKRTAKQKYSELNSSLSELQSKRLVLDERINKTFDAFLDGAISKAIFDEQNERLKTKRNKLDDEIAELKKTQRLSEATINYVCNFISQPSKLWRDAGLEGRQALQRIIFPHGLHIDLCNSKCGTEDLGPLFSVISTKKASEDAQNINMVVPTGIEPVTLGL